MIAPKDRSLAIQAGTTPLSDEAFGLRNVSAKQLHVGVE
jgi:hypothetical protein